MKKGCIFSALVCIAILLTVLTIVFLIDAIPGIHANYTFAGSAWLIISALLCPFSYKIFTTESICSRISNIPKCARIGFTLLAFSFFIGTFTLSVRSTVYEMYPGKINSESDLENAMRGDRELYLGIKYITFGLIAGGLAMVAGGYLGQSKQ